VAALSVPLDRKLDGACYRQMLEAADPWVAALPSSNFGTARTWT
jgi:hypothetical protein